MPERRHQVGTVTTPLFFGHSRGIDIERLGEGVEIDFGLQGDRGGHFTGKRLQFRTQTCVAGIAGHSSPSQLSRRHRLPGDGRRDRGGQRWLIPIEGDGDADTQDLRERRLSRQQLPTLEPFDRESWIPVGSATESGVTAGRQGVAE